MSAIVPVQPVISLPLAPVAAPPAADAVAGSFASLLTEGLRTIETKVVNADNLVKQFALGEDVPVHQVTFALEEARLAVELAMQVRARILEGYRDLMNMQL